MELSARNQLKGKILEVKKGAIMAEVSIEITGPCIMTAEISLGSTERLNLCKDDAVTAIIKSTEVIVGK